MTANKDIIYNEGERKVQVYTEEGLLASLDFQVTDVHKLLLSVSMAKAIYNIVIFSDSDTSH